MSDLKSKLPDLKELGEMTTKLFKDLRNSVHEIIDTYKKKHPENHDNKKEDDSGNQTKTKKTKTSKKDSDQQSS